MAFEISKEAYTGGIKNITLGQGKKAVTVGGETCYPFYQFEGKMPNKPRIAMEVWDMAPEDWPEAALAPFKDVVSDPAAWAKKCVDQFGAEMIVLQLKSTDPNGANASPEAAAATVKKVSQAVDVPLIVWGSANAQKDEAVLKKVAEECQGANLTLGPVEDKNHKGIGAAAMGYGHTVIASSPIDVNLAKQINILLENLGVATDKVIIDPTTGGIGYGLEYSYSVMERIRMAALNQGDEKLQYPIINNLGNEVWKSKEAKQTIDEAPTLGDPEKRGILMEAVGAVSYLMAGSDILIMRHPEAIRLAKSFISLASEGGSAAEVAAIAKKLPEAAVDLAALAPQPDLTIEEEKAKKAEPAAKPAEAPKAAAPKPAPKPAAAPVQEVKVKVAEEARPVVDLQAERAKAEAKTKAESEIKAKADAEARKKAEEEAKVKTEVAAKAKAEAEKKAREEAEARAAAAATAKREAEAEAVRQQREKEREERLAQRKAAMDKTAMKPAAQQQSEIEKMIDKLNRIHKRAS